MSTVEEKLVIEIGSVVQVQGKGLPLLVNGRNTKTGLVNCIGTKADGSHYNVDVHFDLLTLSKPAGPASVRYLG